MRTIRGKVVEADGVSPGTVYIDGGKIVEVRRGIDRSANTGVTYDDNHLIFPGFIDIHTHCREDVSQKDTYKEDYATVGRAALSGGVVCIADMPNNPIVPLDVLRWTSKLKLAMTCPAQVLLYAGINQDSSPFGTIPYKAFMGPSTNHSGDLNFDSYARLDEALSRYRGESVSFHCEAPNLLKLMSRESTHELRRPATAEILAIEVACKLIKKYELRGKICHVSTAIGLETILQYKRDGVDVTCEVTPHHLYFDTEMLNAENHKWLQMNPPIRSKSDREALLAAVRNGDIDYFATDHAPHTKEEKLKGMSGVPQLDTYGPFLAWLMKKQNVDPVTIFNMACKRPGEWVESFTAGKIGRIQPGYAANLTVLDMNRPAVEGRPLYTKCQWSPFNLTTLPGMVRAVWLNGDLVVDGSYIKNG